MTFTQRWALVSELSSNELSGSELAQIAAACSLQLSRDVKREWPESDVVTVQAFPGAGAVPMGYSIARAVGIDEMPQGALGFHYGSSRRPMAKIGYTGDAAGLATTFSHELVEAALDPSGNRLVVGSIPGVGRAEVLVELADPCEAFTYEVDGLPMSDFVTRAYYGPHRWHTPSVKSPAPGGAGGLPVTRPFSFTGHIDAPLVIAKGGYLSFVYPDHRWGQLTWFDGPAPATRVLGERDEADPRSHREWIDAQTAELSTPLLGARAG